MREYRTDLEYLEVIVQCLSSSSGQKRRLYQGTTHDLSVSGFACCVILAHLSLCLYSQDNFKLLITLLR